MNAVVENVQAFVKRFPPFSYLPNITLGKICKNIEVSYYQDHDIIFKEGDEPVPFVFIVYKGAIELTKSNQSGDSTDTYLIDICEEGDMLGLRALLSEGTYLLSAVVHEEALLYSIPAEIVKEAMHAHAEFANYVARLFASQIPQRQNKERDIASGQVENFGFVSTGNDFNTVKPVSPVISVLANTSVHEAATIMSQKNIGALLVKNEFIHPIGIITEADLKRKVVAANRLPSELKVSEIMSAPVVTIKDNPKVSDLLILAANKSIRHFCVTKDGTTQSEITGIVSERDLLAAQGNNPAVLLKKIYQCHTIEGLKRVRDTADQLIKKYLEQETALHFVLDVITHINDAITEKCIDMALEKLEAAGMGKPPVEFCWLSLGSEGRKEQLLRTDQDNALLYENVNTSEESAVNEYFLRLGGIVTEMLFQVGFEKCPGNIMASNKKCCRPLDSWQRQFEEWVLSPEPNALMHSHIFFDLRPVYGKKELATTLQEYIFDLIKKEQRFISFLAYNATLNPVPLSFFRKFVVEKKGEFNDMFDIKARALMPISDSARVLAYDAALPVFNGTLARLHALQGIDNNNRKLFEEVGMAYETLLRLRAQNAFTHEDDGRFVDIHSLNKIQRQNLKQIFSITEKLQQLLKVRFQTDYIR